MTTIHRIQALAAALLCTAAFAAQAEVFVIAHPGTQLAGGDIREVFVGDKQFAGTVKLVPVDNATAQEAFLSGVLKMEAGRYSTLWAKKSFRESLVPPAVKSGDAEVLDYVRKTPGAVGYVTSSPSGVTVIQKY